MCNIDKRLEQQIVATGLSIISKAMEASLSANQPQQTTDVLTAATSAYQQGKITKSQFMAVINALDEQTYQTRAYTVPNGGNSGNQDYLEQSKISHFGNVFGFDSHHDSGNLWSVLLLQNIGDA